MLSLPINRPIHLRVVSACSFHFVPQARLLILLFFAHRSITLNKLTFLGLTGLCIVDCLHAQRWNFFLPPRDMHSPKPENKALFPSN